MSRCRPGGDVCACYLGHTGLHVGGGVTLEVGHTGDQAGPKAHQVEDACGSPLPRVEGFHGEVCHKLNPLWVALHADLCKFPALEHVSIECTVTRQKLDVSECVSNKHVCSCGAGVGSCACLYSKTCTDLQAISKVTAVKIQCIADVHVHLGVWPHSHPLPWPSPRYKTTITQRR